MTITAKYASRCGKCRLIINAGERVEWTPGTKAVHAACPDWSKPIDRAAECAQSDTLLIGWLRQRADERLHAEDCGCSRCFRDAMDAKHAAQGRG